MSATTVAEPSSAQRVEIVLSQLRDLPPLPAVASKLLVLTSERDADIREIISLIEMDPPLSAKVMSMTRKASMGVRGEVNTVERAVLLLGMTAIRNLVLAIQVRGVFDTDHSADRAERSFNRPEFWKHCLAVGCAAELLAQHVKPSVHPQEAFACGLLHDLGKIALDTILPKSYERVFRLNETRMGSLPDLEREILGVDHMVAGKRLAEHWQLPQEITACIWLHHHPPDALPPSIAHADLVRAVYAADTLVRELRLGLSGNHIRTDPAVKTLDALGVSPEAYQQVSNDLGEHIARRAELIDATELTSEKLYLDALRQANHDLNKLNISMVSRNRDLASRSRLLDAVNVFSEKLLPADPVPTVCRRAAAALLCVLPAEKVAVCSQPDTTGLFHFGLSDGTNDRCESGLVSASSEPTGRSVRPGPPGPAEHALPEHLHLARQNLGGGPVWLAPVVSAGEVVGMLLVMSEPDRESVLAASLEQIRPLLSTVGLALINARSRMDAERMAEDLSESNRRLHESQHRLLRQRTLSMIGEMASGAAHELNNPLAVISGRAQMLATQTDPEKAATYARIIQEQAHRCSAIVTELLEFASPPPPQAGLCPLAPLIATIRNKVLRCTNLLPDQFELNLSDELLTVWADTDQLQQALTELIDNALDAMESGQERLDINCSRAPADERVVIAIRDNGRGMSAEVLRRAFDPFFSDRPAGRSRGLGLCHAYRLVEINGGQLRMESAPGKGTTVLLWLPIGPAEQPAG